MTRMFSLLAPLAVLQMTMPAPAGAVMLVPLCAGSAAGRSVPLRIPVRNDGTPCCKICHISMRKRSGTDNCCGVDEDDPDAA